MLRQIIDSTIGVILTTVCMADGSVATILVGKLFSYHVCRQLLSNLSIAFVIEYERWLFRIIL